jgi:hypothetical protein
MRMTTHQPPLATKAAQSRVRLTGQPGTAGYAKTAARRERLRRQEGFEERRQEGR